MNAVFGSYLFRYCWTEWRVFMEGRELTIPDPSAVALTQVRDVLLPSVRTVRDQIAVRKDMTAARELCRQMEAYRRYLKDQATRDLLAAECRRTEVLIGHLLGPPPEPGEDVGRGRELVSPTGDTNDFVKDRRHKDARHKFRLLAAHEDLVERLLAEGRVSRRVVLEKIERVRRLASAEPMPEIRAGDCRECLADMRNESVALVLTDPPYAGSALHLYDALGELAARVLMPGGSLICYSGQAFLPEVLGLLGKHLRYWWTLALTHEHGGQQLPVKCVMAEWKPILWFVKGRRIGREYIADRLRGSRPSKGEHAWAQGAEEVKYLIERLTEPSEWILDPFAGSGSFGRTAEALGRRFVGADLDPESDSGKAS